MKTITTKRAVIALVIIAVVYLVARTNGWTGPATHVQFVDEIMWPAVILITVWGLYRLSKGGGQ